MRGIGKVQPREAAAPRPCGPEFPKRQVNLVRGSSARHSVELFVGRQDTPHPSCIRLLVCSTPMCRFRCHCRGRSALRSSSLPCLASVSGPSLWSSSWLWWRTGDGHPTWSAGFMEQQGPWQGSCGGWSAASSRRLDPDGEIWWQSHHWLARLALRFQARPIHTCSLLLAGA